MERLSITITSNDPCLLYSQELLKHYTALACHSLCFEEGDKEFVLALLKDAPQYEKAGGSITKEDGFMYILEGKKAVFLAKSPRGLLYSVIAYLQDDLGCRFFHVDEEYVPSLSSLPYPSPRTVNPLFAMRNYLVGKCYENRWEEGYVPKVLDTMVKNRVLDVFTPVDKRHGGPAPVYGRNVSHNFHYYCPYEIYGKSHPEFFQEITSGQEKMMTIDITNGIRDEDGTLDDAPVSVAKVVIEEMKKDILAHPECSYFSLTQEDGNEYFTDEHNKALEKKYKRSGILIRFCNAIIKELHAWAKKELNRDVYLVTFAYAYAKEAPVKEENGKVSPLDETVEADPNLIIQMALYSNAFYPYFSSKQDPAVLKCMREWKAIAKRFWFWGYDTDFTNYYAYFDTFHTIKENVKSFHEYGIEYLLMQGSHDAPRNWQTDARSYVYDRLMWDLSLNQDALLQEYLDAYYGPASTHVSSFISLFHKHFVALFEEGKDICLKSWGNENYPSVLPEKIVMEGLNILKEGEKAIIDSSLSDSRKETLSNRLSGVMATPLNTLYLNFDFYYPNGDKADKAAIKEEFVSRATRAGELVARETFSLERYLAFVESDEYKIRPIYINGRFVNGGKEEA